MKSRFKPPNKKSAALLLILASHIKHSNSIEDDTFPKHLFRMIGVPPQKGISRWIISQNMYAYKAFNSQYVSFCLSNFVAILLHQSLSSDWGVRFASCSLSCLLTMQLFELSDFRAYEIAVYLLTAWCHLIPKIPAKAPTEHESGCKAHSESVTFALQS